MNELSQSAQKVQQALQAMNLPCMVVELPNSTRTAVEAAQAVGCQVGQIVKSLIFMGAESRRPILVVASGINRVDETHLALLAGEAIKKADAEFVRAQTGFAIGGIPPVGLANQMSTFIDQDLLAYQSVWAAAGTPHAVFELDPAFLERMTGGTVTNIK
jgi:prolyl-tRNA editing enzyme YbaK/EbsC (Cys-tRNA(Pro) deacylase)